MLEKSMSVEITFESYNVPCYLLKSPFVRDPIVPTPAEQFISAQHGGPAGPRDASARLLCYLHFPSIRLRASPPSSLSWRRCRVSCPRLSPSRGILLPPSKPNPWLGLPRPAPLRYLFTLRRPQAVVSPAPPRPSLLLCCSDHPPPEGSACVCL